MSPWRLEALRLWRTRQLVALGAVFLILGLGIPILTYYLPELIKHAGNGVTIIAPKPKPVDAITGFASNAGQLGTLVLVIVAAANLSIDAHPGISAFYRSRVHRPAALIMPRVIAVTIAGIGGYAIGLAAAWYETAVVLGSVPVGALLGGFALEALWLCFVVSVVALAASLVRSVSGVVGLTIATFLAMALLEALPHALSWFPSSLAGSAGALIGNPLGNLWHAVVVSALAAVGALALAVRRYGACDLSSSAARAD